MNNYIDVIFDTISMLVFSTIPFFIFGLIMHYATIFIRNHFSSDNSWKFISYFTFVGSMVHELSHAIMCVIFKHDIQKVAFFSPEEDEPFGYVLHRYDPNSFYQRCGCFFIGTAPLLCGVASIYYLSLYLLPHEIIAKLSSSYNPFLIFSFLFSAEFYSNIKNIIWLYLSFSIFLHITLSFDDLKGWATGLLTFVILACVYNCYKFITNDISFNISQEAHTSLVLIINQFVMVFIISTIILILYNVKKKSK